MLWAIALAVAGPATEDPPAAPQALPASLPSPRQGLGLASGWRFRAGGEDQPIGEDYDDSGWAPVEVPHSWNRVGSYTRERDPGLDARQGVGWYRMRFPTPAQRGGRQFLQFDGVGTLAEVWLNGRKLGAHRGAFGRFRFEVTGLLRPDWANLLVVRADNSERKAGSPTADVIPLSGDFFLFGGIYRPVSLITTDASQIDLLDHGGPGIYATTTKLADAEASIAVRTRVATPRAVTLSVSLDDDQGRTVASVSQKVDASDKVREVASALRVAWPHRWNGRADPYLYRLRVELSDGRRLLDRVVEPYGIRSFAIDPDKGFQLNGRALPLHGISRHQDRPAKGWAIVAADHAEDMALAQELGANTIRMAHYQHAPEWFDLADRAGMVVWAELPFVNQVGWTDADAAPSLVANAREQLTELIRQNYNRPGIVTWSVGNEVDIHARREKWGNRSRKLLAELAALAKREDPSRPATFADCCEESVDTPLDPAREMLAETAPLIGYNRYFGWYYGKPEQLGPALDLLHARHPKLPIGLSEYGAGGAISQHSDDPRGGPVAFAGRPQPEEYQAWLLEQSWPQIAARQWLWGSWVWNIADFATRSRAEGDATDINTKGLVTADRKTRKDAFYYLQANWSDAPMLHLTGKRYIDRPYPVIDVRAYSNAPRARLSLNGKDLGEVECPGRICAWPGVALEPGANIATVTAEVGVRTLTDSAQWIGPDPKAGLAIDAGALVGGTIEGRRYGSDTFFAGGEAEAVKEPVLNLDAADLSVRRGDFSYRLPLPKGKWRVLARFMGEGTVSRDGKVVAEAHADTDRFKTLRFTAMVVDALILDFHAPDGLASLVVEPEK